jgi:PEP-CTERM motif
MAPVKNPPYEKHKGYLVKKFASIVATLALSAAALSAHAATVDGTISVYQGSTFLGYVSSNYDVSGILTYSASNALSVQIDTSGSPFAIAAPGLTGYGYVGATSGRFGDHLAPGSYGYAYLTGSSYTAPGTYASGSNSFEFGGSSESTIWSLSGDVLTPTWINSDNSSYADVVFYDVENDYLGITGDLGAFEASFNEGEFGVTLDFTPATAATPEPASLTLLATGLASIYYRRRRS